MANAKELMKKTQIQIAMKMIESAQQTLKKAGLSADIDIWFHECDNSLDEEQAQEVANVIREAIEGEDDKKHGADGAFRVKTRNASNRLTTYILYSKGE